jgi:RNA polymerase sigma-70 factor (ECF subfamily)
MAITKLAPEQPGSAVVWRSIKTRYRAALGQEVQEHLGRHLQAAYGDPSSPPLPEHLRQLVDRLEQAFSERDAIGAAEFKEGILLALPSLRAFALSLTHNSDRADDLIQETVLRAWKNRDSFAPGTKLNAWLFTILRNNFHTEFRKRRREVEDADGSYANRLRSAPEQIHKLEIHDLQTALDQLVPEQREALLLVAAQGLSYEEVAAICETAVGTIKSRVNRARVRLAELMGYTKGDLAADRIMQAAMTGGE